MLKKTLSTHDGVDISGLHNLKSFLSVNSKGYKPKKSSVFKWTEIESFFKSASDYEYLALEVCFFLAHIYHPRIMDFFF